MGSQEQFEKAESSSRNSGRISMSIEQRLAEAKNLASSTFRKAKASVEPEAPTSGALTGDSTPAGSLTHNPRAVAGSSFGSAYSMVSDA